MTTTTIRASIRLEPFSTPDDENREIRGIMDRARAEIGGEPNRAYLVVDRTGYQTVIRAQVGRE
jgi:hypothetical protein